MTIFFTLLIWHISLNVWALDCPKGLKQPISELQSGVFNLVPTLDSRRYSYANITLIKDVSTNYQIAVGLSYIQNCNDQNKIDFSIRAMKYSAYFTLLIVISQQSKWKSVQVYYLASSRKDLIVGNFIPDIPDILFPTSIQTSKKLKISYKLPKKQWNIKNTEIIIFPFISGIKTLSKLLDLNIQSSYIDSTQNNFDLVINLIVNNQIEPIEILYLGYIVCRNYNIPFQLKKVSYLIENLLKQKRFNSQDINKFYALSKINPSLWKQNQIMLSLPMIKNSKSSYIPTSTYQQGLQFKLIEKIYMPLVSQLYNPFYVFSCVSSSQCEQIDGYIIKQPQYQCIYCKQNSKYDVSVEKCVCQKGYFLNSKKICKSYASLCKPDEIYSEGNCYSSSLFNYQTFINSIKT